MPEIHLASSVLFNLGPIPVTNTILTTWIVMALIGSFAFLATRQMALIPQGLQNVFEGILEALLGLIEQVTQSRKKAEQFLPFLATFFLFILIANWLELIPGVLGGLTIETSHGPSPLFRSANTDLNTPLALALISVLGTQIMGIMTLGFVRHFGHYLSFRPSFDGLIDCFVGLLHVLGEFSRVISFTFRLFGNIFAGEVLLIVISYLVPYVAPVPFYALELFVGFVQALVFMMLTLSFMAAATTDLHAEEAHR
ncbi:MAG: F0F1 ATP synthase subunit A [Patescibacteria group bacterium]|jgi:F-type H+-transporting ATPase subunit a